MSKELKSNLLLGCNDVYISAQEVGAGGLAFVGNRSVLGAVEVGVFKRIIKLDCCWDGVVVIDSRSRGRLPELVISPLDGDEGGHHGEDPGVKLKAGRLTRITCGKAGPCR